VGTFGGERKVNQDDVGGERGVKGKGKEGIVDMERGEENANSV